MVYRHNRTLVLFRELQQGVELFDENNEKMGVSKTAATHGITAVVLSRISMATPGMLFTPILATFLEKKGVLKRFPWANAPIQTLFCGLCLTFATPLCCALYSQRASIRVDQLEADVQEGIKKRNPDLKVVYYNKGL